MRAACIRAAIRVSVVCALSVRSVHAEPQRAQRSGVDRVMRGALELGVLSARDDLIVPLASTGPALGLSWQFLGALGPGLLESELSARGAALFDRDGRPAAGLAYAMRLGYLPIWRVAQADWSVAAGPLLAWEADILWLARWDDAHAYWMGRRYLGAGLRAWRGLGPRWRVDLGAQLNLMGSESRPPAYRHNVEDALTRVEFYLADVQRGARFGSLLDWQAVRLTADLSRVDSASAAPRGSAIGVELRFLRATEPELALSFELKLRLSYGWGIR